MTTSPRAPTAAEAVKLLRDAAKDVIFAYGDEHTSEVGLGRTISNLSEALALTADASEDAPDVAGMLREKLDAVFKNVASLIEQHTGKPCGPEPLDDLAAILAARPAPVGAGMAVDFEDDAQLRAHMLDYRTAQGLAEVHHRMYETLEYLKTKYASASPAAPAPSAPLCPARKVECGTAPQQWCATCPEWEKARSSPMAAVQAKPEAALQALADQAQELGLGYGDDTARIDWLGERCTGASDSERYLPFRVYWGNKGATQGIRAQIDKARAASATHKGEENG